VQEKTIAEVLEMGFDERKVGEKGMDGNTDVEIVGLPCAIVLCNLNYLVLYLLGVVY